MSEVRYNGHVVNIAVSEMVSVIDNFSSLSNSMKSATNQIISAKGFNEYIGGISSDSFSSLVQECGTKTSELVQSIRQKQVSILAYSQDQNGINEFLDTLSNLDYANLDLSSIDQYISFGRRFGNVLKGVGSSLATAGLGLVEGIMDFGETGADLITLGGTALASIFTGTYDLLSGDDLTNRMWEETKAKVSEKKVENIFNSFYANNEIGQSIKNNAYLYDGIRGVSKGIGYTGALIGANILTGGIASGLGIGASGSITAGQLAATAGAMGFSNGTEEAWADGATTGKGLLYGAAAGAWEGAQWFAGAKINQYGGLGDQVAKGIFKGAASGVGTRIAMDTVDSGLEGFVQPALTMIYKDYGGNSFADNYHKAFESAGGWGNVLTHAAIGGFSSAIGEFAGARRLLKSNETKDIDVAKQATDDGASRSSEIFESKKGLLGAGEGDTGDIDISKQLAGEGTSRSSEIFESKKGLLGAGEGDAGDIDISKQLAGEGTSGSSEIFESKKGLLGAGEGDVREVPDGTFQFSREVPDEDIFASRYPAEADYDGVIDGQVGAGGTARPKEKIKYTNVDIVGPYDEQLDRLTPGTYEAIEGTRIPQNAVFHEIYDLYDYGGTYDDALKEIERIYGPKSIQAMSARAHIVQDTLDEMRWGSVEGYHPDDFSFSDGIAHKAQVIFNKVGLPSDDVTLEIKPSEAGTGCISASNRHFSEDLAYWRNLSDAEKKPMLNYTSGEHEAIGVSLRTGSDLSPGVAEDVRILSEQLEASPGLSRRTVLYRGMDSLDFIDPSFEDMTPDQVAKAINKMANGAVVIGDNSFSSSTPAMGGGFTDKNVVEICSVAAGTKGSYLGIESFNDWEAEYLLQAGSGNRKVILGAECIDGRIYLYTAIP